MTEFQIYEKSEVTFKKEDFMGQHSIETLKSINKFYKLWIEYVPKIYHKNTLEAYQLLKNSIKQNRFDKDCSKLSKKIREVKDKRLQKKEAALREKNRLSRLNLKV